jgi:hypothetical protein
VVLTSLHQSTALTAESSVGGMAVPEACQGIQDHIDALETARAALQGELAAAPTPQKPYIKTQIDDINSELKKLQDNLANCIVANTTIPVTPSLEVSLIQVIQAIQTPTDEAKLVAGKRTGVRVFVTSGLPGGPPFPPGTGVVPNVTGTLTATSVASGAATTLAPLNPGAVIEAPPAAAQDLDRPDHALLFELPDGFIDGAVTLTASAAVAGNPAIGAPTASKTVGFLPQATQPILPVLLSDPLLLLNAPTRTAFAATLATARVRMPIAEQGFVVKPWIETSLSPGIDLRGTLGWGWLCFNLATWVFLFPTQDVGGLRTALVPGDSRYALNGIGAPRVGLTPPASATRSGLGTTMAHEMGHAFGSPHAGCPPEGAPGAPAGIDTSLRSRLAYPGLDVAAGTVIPSGRGALMSYCDAQARWPTEQYWEFVRTRVPI